MHEADFISTLSLFNRILLLFICILTLEICWIKPHQKRVNGMHERKMSKKHRSKGKLKRVRYLNDYLCTCFLFIDDSWFSRAQSEQFNHWTRSLTRPSPSVLFIFTVFMSVRYGKCIFYTSDIGIWWNKIDIYRIEINM